MGEITKGYYDGNKAKITYRAAAALEQHRRVKVTDATTNPATINYAGAGELDIGTTIRPTELGELAAIRPAKDDGTVRMYAATAFVIGDDVYGAANGEVSTTISGDIIGKALEATDVGGFFVVDRNV